MGNTIDKYKIIGKVLLYHIYFLSIPKGLNVSTDIYIGWSTKQPYWAL